MLMDKWERKCKTLCREMVMANLWCEFCGCTTLHLEQHHGLLKSSQRLKLNPFYWYDPTLQFCLGVKCHHEDEAAPHVDQEAFEREMYMVDPDKIDRLRAVNSGPLIKIDARTIDWEKVYANLGEHGRPLGDEFYEEMG